MIELTGKYNTAKVFTDTIDEASISQIIGLLNQPFVENQRIRFMPDVHAGAGCTIGTTMTIADKVCPNLVGVDIGCGMLAIKLAEKEIDFPSFDKMIREKIPSGHDTQKNVQSYNTEIKELDCIKMGAKIDLDLARHSIGSLGGGNHFIEVDKDEDDNLWLVIHSGSRHLGLEVAKWYQNEAYRQMIGEREGAEQERGKRASAAIIEDCIKTGRKNEISKLLKEMGEKQKKQPISKDLAYCEGSLTESYLHDMAIVQRFAKQNRSTMADLILKWGNLHEVDRFETIHNYIDIENRILRKGSVSAQYNERLIIPINMRDGSLICLGKGNEDWNFSAPHGAGRVMSRSEARDKVSFSEYEESMKGIFSTSVLTSTIDESPMVYKPIEEIIENVKNAVEIISIIKPVYNFKAS